MKEWTFFQENFDIDNILWIVGYKNENLVEFCTVGHHNIHILIKCVLVEQTTAQLFFSRPSFLMRMNSVEHIIKHKATVLRFATVGCGM